MKAPFLTFLLAVGLLVLPVSGHAASGDRRPDFTSYDKPLFEQITDRIKTKVAARLGEGKLKQDRFFIIPFAYQNKGNAPEFSHSFMTVIRIFGEGGQPTKSAELTTRSYNGWKFEAFTISWIPQDFDVNPHLCVFDGLGSRVFPNLNKCPISIGKDFNLESTIKLAASFKVVVAMWGPYEITKPGFDLGVKRKLLLDTGTIKYRADDRPYRKSKVAINCFHAMQGLDDLFPNGGFLDTGLKMWGLNGTARVLLEYTTKATNKGLLLEPVDIKNDRYGFVYASDRDARRIYNPFRNASAYHQ